MAHSVEILTSKALWRTPGPLSETLKAKALRLYKLGVPVWGSLSWGSNHVGFHTVLEGVYKTVMKMRLPTGTAETDMDKHHPEPTC